MIKWLACGDKFTTGDVLRWKEPDWFLKGRRKKEFFKKGERRVTAEVASTDKKGYVHLVVRKCEVVSDHSFRGVKVLKAGERIMRKRATLKKHKAERMTWAGTDGEGARTAVTGVVVSRFLR
jgi:hypothetical protein